MLIQINIQRNLHGHSLHLMKYTPITLVKEQKG